MSRGTPEKKPIPIVVSGGGGGVGSGNRITADDADSDSDSANENDGDHRHRHGYGGRMGLTRHGQVLPSFEATTLPPEKRTTNTPTKQHPTKADKILSAKNSLRNILVHSLEDDHDDFIHEYEAAASSASKGSCIILLQTNATHITTQPNPSPTIYTKQQLLPLPKVVVSYYYKPTQSFPHHHFLTYLPPAFTLYPR